MNYTTSLNLGRTIAAFALVALLFGQASVARADQWYSQSPTCNIWTTDSSISEGDNAEIVWSANYANSAYLNEGIGSVPTNGARDVYPDETTTYTLTVYGSNGRSAQCSTTIYVDEDDNDDDLSCSIHASPNNVPNGGSTTIYWNAEGADSAWLSEFGSVDDSGSRYISNVYGTKTYTLTVQENGDTETCQTTIYAGSNNYPYQPGYPNYPHYGAAPSCTITLSGFNYAEGYNRSATLNWTSYNASSAHISNIGSVAVNGAQVVYPQYNTHYVLTVNGPGGTATCSTSGTVQAPIYPTTYPTFSNTYPYISLTQIPYTGLDLGLGGTIMYFLSIMALAGAGAYLMVYFNGGVLRVSFANEVATAARNQARAIASILSR